MKLFKKKTIEDILKIENKETMLNELYKYLAKKSCYGEELENLNEKEKVLFIAMDFESEVIDGGLEQYLYNVSYNIEETYNCFYQIGRNDIADIIMKMIQLFPNSYIPSLQKERVNLIELLLNDGPLFDELNQQLQLDLLDNYIQYIENNFNL